MTKTFPLLPDLTCPELAGYKLLPIEDGKPEFSESQVMQAIEMARKYPADVAGFLPDEIIASIRTPRHPIAIEVEMEKVKVNPMGRIVDPMNLAQNQSSCKWEERPCLNPDGTVKVRWVYE